MKTIEKAIALVCEMRISGHLQPVSIKILDEDEFLEVVCLPFDQALQMVLDGEITDGKTQNAILKTALLIK